jgi:hypothetical protein
LSRVAWSEACDGFGLACAPQANAPAKMSKSNASARTRGSGLGALGPPSGRSIISLKKTDFRNLRFGAAFGDISAVSPSPFGILFVDRIVRLGETYRWRAAEPSRRGPRMLSRESGNSNLESPAMTGPQRFGNGVIVILRCLKAYEHLPVDETGGSAVNLEPFSFLHVRVDAGKRGL